MADVWGSLGQQAPSAGVTATLYTVPVNKHAEVRVGICNRSGNADTYRVARSPAGAAISAEHYKAYNKSIDGNESVVSKPFACKAGDVLRVSSANGNLTFECEGVEEDN